MKKFTMRSRLGESSTAGSAACIPYKKLGYREAGVVLCKFNDISSMRLVCLEKKVEKE